MTLAPSLPATKGDPGLHTIQENPKDRLEVLGCDLPQREGLTGCLRDQAQKEDDGVFCRQRSWVDVAVGRGRV